MRRMLALALAVCLLGMAAYSVAQPPPPPPGGKGPKGEFGKEGRGSVDPAASVARMFDLFDKNKDGKLTKEEITDERLLNLFERADANKDGIVTKEELLALFTKEALTGGGKDGPPGGPKGKGGPPGGPKGGPGGPKGPPPEGGPKGPPDKQ
jgi:EF hand